MQDSINAVRLVKICLFSRCCFDNVRDVHMHKWMDACTGKKHTASGHTMWLGRTGAGIKIKFTLKYPHSVLSQIRQSEPKKNRSS